MKNLEDFIKPTQKELFNLIRKKYRGEAIVRMDSYILVPGEAPIMLLAHLDTVHKKPVKHICKSAKGNILMSPQGIGGDDRCGVYALVKSRQAAPIKPWLLFTCDEEIGGLGADTFVDDYVKGKMPKSLDELKLLVEIDRKGYNDAVYYNCDNPKFEEYITSKGFVTAEGSFSDISIVAPELGVAAVNLSSGYYNAHTLHEFKKYKGSDLDISSNYVQAMGEVRVQMLIGTATKVMPKLKKALEQRQSAQDGKSFNQSADNENIDINDILPDGYALFSQAGSGLVQSANTITENAFAQAFNDIADKTGVPIHDIMAALSTEAEHVRTLGKESNFMVESRRSF